MGRVFSISQLPLIASAFSLVALQSAAEKWTTSLHTGSSKMTFFREDLCALSPRHGEWAEVSCSTKWIDWPRFPRGWSLYGTCSLYCCLPTWVLRSWLFLHLLVPWTRLQVPTAAQSLRALGTDRAGLRQLLLLLTLGCRGQQNAAVWKKEFRLIDFDSLASVFWCQSPQNAPYLIFLTRYKCLLPASLWAWFSKWIVLSGKCLHSCFCWC